MKRTRQDRYEKLLSSCSQMNFGSVHLLDKENDFRRKFNQEIVLLCKSLPESTQTDAILFLTQYLVTPIGRELNFFANYYAPAWSIIYWLVQSGMNGKRFEHADIKSAVSAHSMALFLHPLDDHLNDGQLPASHLHLLLRSQAWMMMNAALECLSAGIDGGEKFVRHFINDYYSSICNKEEVESLDSYCEHFRKQMATWMIAPLLLAKKISPDEGFTKAIQSAYGSFGIAWRLLDDLRDIKADMTKGEHSAVYVCLPASERKLWDDCAKNKFDQYSDSLRLILDGVQQYSVIESLKRRICCELDSAASITQANKMEGLADEFRCLSTPLRVG